MSQDSLLQNRIDECLKKLSLSWDVYEKYNEFWIRFCLQYEEILKIPEKDQERKNLQKQVSQLKLQLSETEKKLKQQESEWHDLNLIYNELQVQLNRNQQFEKDFFSDQFSSYQEEVEKKDSLIEYLKKEIIECKMQLEEQKALTENFISNSSNQNLWLRKVYKFEIEQMSQKINTTAFQIQNIEQFQQIPIFTDKTMKLQVIHPNLQGIELQYQSLQNTTQHLVEIAVTRTKNSEKPLEKDMDMLQALHKECYNATTRLIQYLTEEQQKEGNFLLKLKFQKMMSIMQFNQKLTYKLFTLFNQLNERLRKAHNLQQKNEEILQAIINGQKRPFNTDRGTTEPGDALPILSKTAINNNAFKKARIQAIQARCLEEIQNNSNKFIKEFLKSINIILYNHFLSHQKQLYQLKPEILSNKITNKNLNNEKLLEICMNLIERFSKMADGKQGDISRVVCNQNYDMLLHIREHSNNIRQLFLRLQKIILTTMF